ncbi:AAA family ATPase [Microbacterium sp. K24]|uniref:AAA family ATPase n=1 Tax=Microbacterium sp. K24 TaxID=2305446 RepID=UPI00109D6474|nr:AAA family ATPase [Microbacterium sp. K24]
MRIVVSGTHGSGKSTLIADFVAQRPEYLALGDPFEDLDLDDPASAASFAAQLRLTASRLRETAGESSVISERGPLDFLAYLTALEQWGRSDSELVARATAIADASLTDVDLVVLLPLDERHPIRVPVEEDRVLREAMDAALLDLADEREVAGGTRFLTLGGDPASRLRDLLAATNE